ncbi:MAG: hypothetical protein NVSMB38_42160 [Ktedonobacteraceae bacterium]
MKQDIHAFNLLRFGLLPGIAILALTLLITTGLTIALKLLVIAAIPLLLGCFVLHWMFASFGLDINQRLSDSIEKAQYLRPSYILCLFVLVSMTVAVLNILWKLSPNITLPLILVVAMLLTLIMSRMKGHTSPNIPVTLPDQEDYIPTTAYGDGYREDRGPRQTAQESEGLHTYEQPQAHYPQTMSPPVR